MTDVKTDHDGVPTRRRTLDPLTLAAGLATLGISVGALLDGFAWLPGVDVRWALAALAILVGLALVFGSLRPRTSR